MQRGRRLIIAARRRGSGGSISIAVGWLPYLMYVCVLRSESAEYTGLSPKRNITPLELLYLVRANGSQYAIVVVPSLSSVPGTKAVECPRCGADVVHHRLKVVRTQQIL